MGARARQQLDGHGARSIGKLGGQWVDVLRSRSFSTTTINNRIVALARFAGWCDARGVDDVTEVTRPIIARYQRWLFYFRTDKGRALSPRVQHNHLTGIRQFFRWLTREGLVLSNPASELDMPRLPKTLPRTVLTTSEVEQLMIQPDLGTPYGVRDRAMLETLYSTGMRRTELLKLTIYDVDEGRGTVFIHLGKGGKDRVVPIGDRALQWIRKYLDEVRPKLAVAPDDGTLFLGQRGEGMDPVYLSDLVTRYVDKAELGKRGSCHLLRHTAATLMLEGGADIRFIQAMLGHADLSTTQVYTRVSIMKLKQVHTATHPGATLERKAEPSTERDAPLPSDVVAGDDT